MLQDWIRSTTDQVICTAPCYISTVAITPTSASKRADCTLYDGESTSDPQLIRILSGAGETKVVSFNPPLETKRGLYLDFGGDTHEVIVQFCWGKE